MDYYSDEMNARREKFNRIIRDISMVLINNIPEVDGSVYDNWQDKSPMDDCDVIDISNAPDDIKEEYPSAFDYFCQEHEEPTELSDSCDRQGETAEIYQWFAINDNDAEYLQKRNQYITYSDMLDTYFLAICHFGTGWDYVDSMVNDILGDK